MLKCSKIVKNLFNCRVKEHFMENIVYIKCKPSEENFSKLFRWVDEYRANGVPGNGFEFLCIEGENFKNETDRKIAALLKKGKHSICTTKPNYKSSRIVIDILIPNDETAIDTFFFRYLILLKNQLLRKNDIIIIDCNYVFYCKVSSFFCFESLDNSDSSQLFAWENNEVKKFSLWFNPSSEWLPAMSFYKNDRNGLYNILSNPICTKKQFKELYFQFKNEGSDFKKLVVRMTNVNGIKQSEFCRWFLLFCVFYWMDKFDTVVKDYIMEQVGSVPALALLIFSIQLKFRSKSSEDGLKKYNLNENLMESFLNVSLDFAEGLLQIIENVIGHSQGGCFLFRINNNLVKLTEEITYNQLSVSAYIRISVIDYSKEGIVDRIKKKNKITQDMTLKEVFCFSKIQNNEYRACLLNEDSTVHHYGLSIFSSIVLQHYGCFVVKSSGTEDIDIARDFCVEANPKGFNLKNSEQVIKNHVPGTEYNISLPLIDISNSKSEGITSVFSEVEYDPKSLQKKPVFESPISNFFDDEIDQIVRERIISYEGDSVQENKEKTINISADILSCEIEKYDEKKSVFYFYVDNERMPYKRSEIIAKVLLKTFLILNKKNKKINVVLYGISDLGIRNFVRQFSLFYRNGICRYMEDNQVYIVSKTYKSEVLIYGGDLRTSYTFLCSQRFKYGASFNVAETLKYIVSNLPKRQDITRNSAVQPLDYDILRRIELIDGKPQLSCGNRKWFYYKLESVINSDIHGRFLGCKMANTHVRVNNVHIDTFYECRLLFGNPFWCRMFSYYLAECILQDDHIDTHKPIILYGYETYSEQLLLYIKKNILQLKKGVQVEYIIFENSKYITSNTKSQCNIRYLDRTFERLGTKMTDANYVFINGISTTLSTFRDQLYNQLENDICSHYGFCDIIEKSRKVAFVIVQVVDDNNESVANDYIEFDINCEEKGINYVRSKKGYLDFIDKKRCGYLITAHSKWYAPDKCRLCQPEEMSDEKYLVETNDTSTVPMILIKPSVSYPSERLGGYNETRFLESIENQKYLYYGHLNRGDNHYQFYIRTAHYVQDQLHPSSELRKWFGIIKKREMGGDENIINIIISPEHYSNATLVSSVNEYVFDNQAHVITISTKKEFRESFEAKFNNYRTMIDLIIQEMPDVKFTLNFYYVDDQLVTGSNYYRARSLVKGLVEKIDEKNSPIINKKANLRIEVFKAAIILINRNSNKTINNLNVSSFYSFINLNTPSIRAYGDSCPICQEVIRLNHIVNESSLFSTERYWWKRLERYAVHTLQEAKKAKECTTEANVFSIRQKMKYEYKGFIRLQCSEEIWRTLRKKHADVQEMKAALEECTYEYLNQTLSSTQIISSLNIMMEGEDYLFDETVESDYKIEYLISFLKVSSRPPIIYQENVNSAVLQILLELYNLYFSPKATNSFYESILKLIDMSSEQKKYDLYRVIISCLCSLSSNLFWRDKGHELNKCFELGMNLESNVKKSELPDVSFDVFFRSQLKKNMYSNKDSTTKVSLMERMLLSQIKGGDD